MLLYGRPACNETADDLQPKSNVQTVVILTCHYSMLSGSGAPGSDTKVTKIFKRSGIGKIELESASAGDVVSVAGKSLDALRSTSTQTKIAVCNTALH